MKKLAIAGLATVVSTAAVADVNFYGFLKGDLISTDKIDGDHQPFFATQEKTGYSKFDKATQRTISFRESRFGADFDNGSKVKGKLEFDLAGQDGNSAGVTKSDSGNFRWRQANLQYSVGENGTLSFGKQWSRFAGLNPHTIAVSQVGLYQGNTGFLTDSIYYSHNMNDLTLTFELGASGTDNSPLTDVNVVSNPSTAIRLDYKLNNHSFGIVHLVADKDAKTIESIDHDGNSGTPAVALTENISISGTKVFADLNFGMTNVRAEYVTGKNLFGIGFLAKQSEATELVGIGSGAQKDDVEETAMFVSAKHQMGKSAVWARFGKDEITNADDVLTAASQIVANSATAIGYSHELDKDFTAYGEYTMVSTEYVDSADVTKTEEVDGTVVQLGMMYKF